METIGRYLVVRQLGQGAMGKVFLARDPTLDRSVALKLLHEDASQEDARARFHAEAKTLAALSHPGIVMIFEIGEHEGQAFIAMEYLAGRSLRELLQRPELGARRADLISICARVAVAVAAAHAAGILHRDIKPENVVVLDDGSVKVVDFGIARRLDAVEPRRASRRFATPFEQRVDELIDAFTQTLPVTTTGRDTELTAGTQTAFGTPGYMAPEVLTGNASSAASDVYALGVMLYECLAGHRPYDGPSLIEVMARVIDGSTPPARLDDELADLVDRMLAREPRARPGLDEVAGALAGTTPPPPTPPPRAKRWPWVVAMGGLGVAALAVVGWRLTRDPAPAPAVSPPATVEPMSIAVEPIQLVISDYGSHNPAPSAIADVLRVLISDIDGDVVIPPADLFAELRVALPTGEQAEPALPAEGLRAVERKLGVRHAVRGSIEQRADGLHARLEVIALPGGATTVIEVSRPAAELAALMNDLAERIARVGDPHAKLDRAPNRRRARTLSDLGEANLADNRFYNARPYFEQAVAADPTSFEAWNALATTRAWMFAPEDDVMHAIDTAHALAPPGEVMQLLAGTSLYYHEDYKGAVATLSPLEPSTTLGKRERRDLLYYLGEAHWHDGEQGIGADYFRKALVVDSRFMPAMIHPMQYALALRDVAEARHMIDLQRSVDYDPIEFAVGHYAQLAQGKTAWALWARLVIGQPPSPELEAIVEAGKVEWASYHLALAVERGDTAAGRRAIDDAWKVTVASGRGALTPQDYYALQMLAEVMLCAGMLDDTRRFVTFLADKATARPVGGYPRLALLAAPLLGERAWIVQAQTTPMTTRNARLAEAMSAELSGDRRRAVQLLTALIADPSPTWDYPERAALLRNLRALGRRKEARALCADTLRPAVFRYALLPMRKLCR